MNEEWKAVPGYEGLYDVSSMGLVRSLDRFVNSNKGSRRHRGRILTPNFNHKYARVSLCKDGIVTYKNIHNLVAMAFLDYDPASGLVVDHWIAVNLIIVFLILKLFHSARTSEDRQ